MIYLFSDKAHEGVVHLPLIRIVYDTSPINLEGIDAIIFTSQNSVKALESLGVAWKNKACYAIGEATAATIQQLGGCVAYIAQQAYGDSFAHELIPLLKQSRVLFPRAQEVVSPLFQILHDAGIAIEERIVYTTQCCDYPPSQAPEDNAILIFTSPSTVQCFAKNFAWNSSYIAIAIGKKTAAVIPSSLKIYTSEKQTIEACVELAKAL